MTLSLGCLDHGQISFTVGRFLKSKKGFFVVVVNSIFQPIKHPLPVSLNQSINVCLSLSLSLPLSLSKLTESFIGLEDNISSSKVMRRSLASNTRWASQALSPRLQLQEWWVWRNAQQEQNCWAHGPDEMWVCWERGGGLAHVLWVLAAGTQPLRGLDQRYIPGHRTQSLESNRRCTECDLLYFGCYRLKSMGLLSIHHMAEMQRWLLKCGHWLRGIWYSSAGRRLHTGEGSEALSFPWGGWHHKA